MKDGERMPFFYNGLGPPKIWFNWMAGRPASPEAPQSPNIAQADQKSQILARRPSRDEAIVDQQSHAHNDELSMPVRR